ncbi:GH39 family glycosyl hydrolase [Methylomonas rosea]|uniref:Glycosyl hydrolases family 39 N-terminal catalytic domain-containing protein n=1 Tax=Methylomonas rosea TaxID=2952227 RepID=A0ABT1TZ99_9GAMM|nr:hypothetical protein [Methylomonas sp. WSC-7]MCQ8119762.1 hypothetical protein [Methylomonas sp. WSC-7]
MILIALRNRKLSSTKLFLHPQNRLHGKPSPNHPSYRYIGKLLSLLAGLLSFTESQAFQTITVEPQVQYNVSRYEDIKLMRSYFQEASLENPISKGPMKRLAPLGISKARILNVESPNSLSIDPTTKQFRFSFSSRLPLVLENCKSNNLIPHIGVAQVQQNSIATGVVNGRHYGVADWTAYEAYAYAFLKFVTIDNGFSEADFEVANEPDTTGSAWLFAEKLGNSSKRAMAEYLKVYAAWSNATNKLSKEHPELKIRLGGPGMTTFSFGGFGTINWAEQFLKGVVAQKSRLDFFSFHFYGNVQPLMGLPYFGRYPTIDDLADFLHTQLNDLGLTDVPINFSEWGPSFETRNIPKALINGNNIGAAWTARFVLDAAENNIDEGALLTFMDHQSANDSGELENMWGWPSLLHSNGITPKALNNVATMLSRLPGKRVLTSPVRQGSVGAIASSDKSKVGVMVFNQNWDFINVKELAPAEQARITIKKLPFTASKVNVFKSVMDETRANPYFIHLNKNLSRWQILDATGLRSTRMQQIPVINGSVTLPDADLAPSSVTLWEITPAN